MLQEWKWLLLVCPVGAVIGSWIEQVEETLVLNRAGTLGAATESFVAVQMIQESLWEWSQLEGAVLRIRQVTVEELPDLYCSVHQSCAYL